MANFINMPRLSPTMEEGTLAKWNKSEGDRVGPGDIIAEVETDKANMDFPLEDEGVLLKLLVKPGDVVKLGAPVAILGEKGEDFSVLLREAGQGGQAAAAKPATELAPQAGSQAPAAAAAQALASVPGSGEAPMERGEHRAQAPADAGGAAPAAPAPRPAAPPPAEPGRTLASPLARRLAGDEGLDIRQIQGSGPGGRVVKRDVERALAERAAAPAPAAAAPVAAPAAPAPVRPGAGDELQPLSMMRRTIARRLVEAKATVPHFYLTTEAGVDALWRFREDLNAAAGGAVKVSINDLIIKAVARALRQVPAANASFSPEGIVRHGRVDVGVAVALEDGLLTPVVRGADQKAVGAIAAEVRDLAERGRQKRLRPEEYQGGTFTVSNLGMYGIREFFAIINPPESGILAVGKVEKRPVVVEHGEEDHVVVQRRLTLTLSCDHRVVDGALGARLLAEVVRGLEQPLLLVL